MTTMWGLAGELGRRGGGRQGKRLPPASGSLRATAQVGVRVDARGTEARGADVSLLVLARGPHAILAS